MVVVGGVTRLTQSGLSMVEWRPLMGVLPPLSQVEWMAVFEKYQAFPEYQQINAGMSLAEFKQIFWWEYGHRVLGRLIGLIYFLPLLYFWIRGMVPKHWRIRLVWPFRSRRLTGCDGLVHGNEWPCRLATCESISVNGSSGFSNRHIWFYALVCDGLFASR